MIRHLHRRRPPHSTHGRGLRAVTMIVVMLPLFATLPSSVQAEQAIQPATAAEHGRALASPEGAAITRVLLVGDSWANFMWTNRSLRDAFAANGRPDIVEEGSSTAISGTTAAFWTDPSELLTITDSLDAEPTIDVVQLTIGGNDLLAGQSGGGWWVGMPSEDYQALEARILGDISTVLDHLLAHDAELRIVISLYDYTNFVDSSLFPGCQSTWNDLGQPTPLEINTANTDLELQVAALATARPRVSFVSHAGLMQFTFGFPDDGIQPGDLLPPGDLSRPSPSESMFLGFDCFHLGSTGYSVLAQNLWDQFYAEHFDDGSLFADGFETGDFVPWSSSSP